MTPLTQAEATDLAAATRRCTRVRPVWTSKDAEAIGRSLATNGPRGDRQGLTWSLDAVGGV